MRDIPFDVLEVIVPLCPRKDLLALSQVGRAFQDLAERRLYANIQLMNISKTCRALNSVAYSASPRGSFVLDFMVHDSCFKFTNPGFQLLEGFYRLLEQALKRMSNLRGLYLLVHPSKAWVIRHCATQSIVTNIPAGPILASWLEKQDRLVTFLHADRSPHPLPNDFTVSPNAATGLRFIGARGGILERLVPGRPVICAYLDYTDDYHDDDGMINYLGVMNALELSTGPLHTLSVHFQSVTVTTAQSLVAFCETPFSLSHVLTLDLHWPKSDDYIMDVSLLIY
jgi:hypothetical protein